ncbi:MAG: ABC transporter ATP-binding protein [Desulfobacteraceae bacterium]
MYQRGPEEIHALEGIDLAIESGEFIAITGKSGCGKSTLLHIIGGLEVPTTGQVSINGQNLNGLSDAQLTLFRRDQVGMVFQSFNLLPMLTVQENVALPRILQGYSYRRALEEATAWLEEVELGARQHHKPHQISGGEMQRAAIARALINDPLVIIADEPTGNLDTRLGTQVMEIFTRLQARWQKTVILATHAQEAARYSNRILQLIDGQLAS